MEREIDMEMHTEYDNLDAAQEAEDVDNQGEVENSASVIGFLEAVGPTFHVGASVGKTLGHLIPDTVLEDVVKQSNMYAKEVMEHWLLYPDGACAATRAI